MKKQTSALFFLLLLGSVGRSFAQTCTGKTVLTKTFDTGPNPVKALDLSGFGNGQYFVRMETAGQRSVVKRLVVSRMY